MKLRSAENAKVLRFYIRKIVHVLIGNSNGAEHSRRRFVFLVRDQKTKLSSTKNSPQVVPSSTSTSTRSLVAGTIT